MLMITSNIMWCKPQHCLLLRRPASHRTELLEYFHYHASNSSQSCLPTARVRQLWKNERNIERISFPCPKHSWMIIMQQYTGSSQYWKSEIARCGDWMLPPPWYPVGSNSSLPNFWGIFSLSSLPHVLFDTRESSLLPVFVPFLGLKFKRQNS